MTKCLRTDPRPFFSFLRGFVTKEVAFFHKDSKSLIEADLLFNLPPKEQVRFPLEFYQRLLFRSRRKQYSKSTRATFSILTQAFNPWSYAHKRLVWSGGSDKESEISFRFSFLTC